MKYKNTSRHEYRQYTIIDGKKSPVINSRRTDADVMSTWVSNSNGSETILYLTLDLDVENASSDAKDSKGRICPKKIIQTLMANGDAHLAQYISDMPRSYSGKGLAVVFPITPLPLMEKTIKNQYAAKFVLYGLYRIFAAYGFGPDKGALSGLKRFFTCPFNPQRKLHEKLMNVEGSSHKQRLDHAIWSDKNKGESRSVISELANIIKNHPHTKIDIDRLWNDSRCESKFISVFDQLLEEGWENGYSHSYSRSDFTSLTNLSLYTWYKLIEAKGTHWLNISQSGDDNSYVFSLVPKFINRMKRRSDELAGEIGKIEEYKAVDTKKALLIKSPNLINENQNNHWVWSQAVILKINGITQEDCEHAISGLRDQSEQALKSRNFNHNLKFIVSSIYKRPPYASPKFPMPHYLSEFISRGTVNIRSNTGPPLRVA